MDSPFCFTSRQCNHDPIFVLKSPCTSYHAPYASTFLHPQENGRTMPRQTSLPSITSAMLYTDSLPKGTVESIKRSGSAKSLPRSVAGMKTLLPLKLSSSLPISIFNSPAPSQRSAFDLEQQDSILRKPRQSPKPRFNVPRPLTIRREQYRDTPVYTEPGSPLNLAYYTDEEVSLKTSPVDPWDEFSIIHGFISSSSGSEDGRSEDLDEKLPLPEGSSLARRNLPSRSSDLSFKCLGDIASLSKFMFCDEGAWLSSPLNKWDCSEVDSLPQLLTESMPVEHDIEGWLSDTSSICEEDSYSFATALTPTRAQVIEVGGNGHRPSTKIPPRSSSLVGTRPQSVIPDEDGLSYRDSFDVDDVDPWIEDDFQTRPWLSRLPRSSNTSDLSLPSPPLSPVQFNSSTSHQAAISSQSNQDSHTHPDEFIIPATPEQYSTTQIISALEVSTSQFPSIALDPETPYISAIRINLHQASPSHLQWEVPAPPPSPFSSGVDWRPHPHPTPSTPRPKTTYITTLQRTFSTQTSKTAPITQADFHSIREPSSPSHNQEPILAPRSPNLLPLAAIFPNTTHEERSTLYAHIIAYLFITSLPSHQHTPQPHTPPASPTKLPYYSTTSQSIPQKAADRLGMPVSGSQTRRVHIGDDAVILPQSAAERDVMKLAEKLRVCIGWLIAEMGGDVEWGKEVDVVFLRALGEVVRGCERVCFGLS